MAQHTHSKYMYILLFAPCKLRCWQVMHHKMDAMEVRQTLTRPYPPARVSSSQGETHSFSYHAQTLPSISRDLARASVRDVSHTHVIMHHMASYHIIHYMTSEQSYDIICTSYNLICAGSPYATVWYTSSCMHVYATYREWMRITINDICILHSLNDSVWYIFLNELLCTVDCAGRHTHNVYVIKIAFYGTCP